MSLVSIRYQVGVLEGKATGVTVDVGDRNDPLGLQSILGPRMMKRRITGMIREIKKVLRRYVRLQFETSGRAFATIGPELGLSGSPDFPWPDLSDNTVFHRIKGWGYYGGVPGGDFYSPRVWTGRSQLIAQKSVRSDSNGVSVDIRDAIMAFSESTRPVFVLREVAEISKAVARTFFGNVLGKDLVGEGTFNFGIGRRTPFSAGEAKVGRPKGSTTVSQFLSNTSAFDNFDQGDF